MNRQHKDGRAFLGHVQVNSLLKSRWVLVSGADSDDPHEEREVGA